MRYRRQTHDLMVPVPDGPVTSETARKLVESFEEYYEAVYGKGAGFRFAGIELTTFRVVGGRPHAETLDPQAERGRRAEAGNPPHLRAATLKWTEADVFAMARTCPPDSASPARPSSNIPKPRSMSGPARPRSSTMPAISPSISPEAATMNTPLPGQSRSNASIDPITFEVIRHKLEAITEEQAITLKNVSGSPVVTEATDFNVGIYLADGAIVNMGPQVIFHAGTMSTVIYSIIEHFSDNPGINEGDMFILNDPYRGAIHQPDVSIVMPIFHDGRRIAWTGSCAHELDTGGMTLRQLGVRRHRRAAGGDAAPGRQDGRKRRAARRHLADDHGHDPAAACRRPRLQGDDRRQQRRQPPLSPS